jgi:dethiobiotin synthase
MKGRAQGFFVTGTGTDVGKTYVSRLLVEGLSRTRPVSYMKPVQTGCERQMNSPLCAPDFEYVKKSGVLIMGDHRMHVPYRFAPACSPHLAARLARTRISLRRIISCFDKIRNLPGMDGGCVVVEGAGGALVPLGPSESMVHLMRRLGIPAIIVTTPGLGTLNHTFLTMCALASADVRVAGLIVNNRRHCLGDYIYRDNMKTLRGFANGIPVVEVKHGSGCTGSLRRFCDEIVR